MNNYIFLIAVGLLVIVLLVYTIYNTITENFSSDDVQDYNSDNDIFIRKSINLDLIEDNSYLLTQPNDIVNTNYVNEFKYLGPVWKNEFDYNNSEVLKVEYKRNKMLEHVREFDCGNKYKTFINVNNTTFCGGSANRCNAAVDCCGGASCIDGRCTF